MTIDSFDGEYRFLSNFYPDDSCETLEHKYQAAKATNAEDYFSVLHAPTPAKAKKQVRAINGWIENWDARKLRVMEQLLREKFSDEPLRSQLLSTRPHELIEGNWWGDTFWGVDLRTGKGQNHLGKLLMEIREDLILLK